MPDNNTIAALDLGSNSFHLVIAREVSGRFEILHKEKMKVLLADGLDSNLTLSQSAIDRALNALAQFQKTLEGFNAYNVKTLATYTLRVAKNRDVFLAQAKNVFDFDIQIVSGHEEARLIYQGVAHYRDDKNSRLVMDIGGGSTEFIIGTQFEHALLASCNIGCVSLQKKYFHNGTITAKAFRKAIVATEQKLTHHAQQFKHMGWQISIGTSGTIKQISQIIASAYQQDVITLAALEDLQAELIAFGHIDAITLPGLNDDRRNIICSGIAILITIFELFELETLEYCDFSLREGALHEMQFNGEPTDIRENSVTNLASRFYTDTEQSARVNNTIMQLYGVCQKQWRLSQSDLSLMQFAAKLYEVGLSINSSGLQKHSAYIVSNSQLAGFNQKDHELLVTLLRNSRKKIKKEHLIYSQGEPKQNVLRMICLLRLAILFNQKRQADLVKPQKITCKPLGLQLFFEGQWLSENGLLLSELEQEQNYLEKQGITLEIKRIE